LISPLSFPMLETPVLKYAYQALSHSSTLNPCCLWRLKDTTIARPY
jgi:hypothetical protein